MGTVHHPTMANVATLSDHAGQYEGLYRAQYPRVLRLCRLLLDDPHEAEDVAQDVFLKLLQALQTETRAMTWEAWLTRVTLNACRDRRRSGWWKWWRTAPARGQQEWAEVAVVPDGARTPEAVALSREAQLRIWQAFRELPQRQREVFALRYVEEYSIEVVATALGLSPGSVKQHLFRAIRRLRKAIGGD